MRKIIAYIITTLFTLTLQAENVKVLFIGDSVTDGGWGNSAGHSTPSDKRNQWDKNHIYGHSYMMLCAAHFQSNLPEYDYEFMNRGISGDDLTRLEARWEKDVNKMNPDVLSVLVGTNDVHYYLENKESDFDFAGWELRYRGLLDQARNSNPKIRFVLGTPFVAKVGKIGANEDYALRDSLIHRLSGIVVSIAKDYDAVLLRYDELFAAQKKEHPLVPMKQWIWDGIHPTAAGHRLMADLWIKQCSHLMRTDNRKTISVTTEDLEKCPEGPYQANWQSVAEHYRTPQWFKDAKFGIFIHWGVYSVPAAGSEWYPKHMYNGLSAAHREKWGDQKSFGYKDFIPMFKAEKFNPQQWAELFEAAGARYVIPTAEHHDGFAMYDSKLTRWDAKDMGPHRDIIGELAEAVRGKGMKFGVSNHRIENWDFMYPLNMSLDDTDLMDPEYADLYGPPQKPILQSGMGPKALAVPATGGATEAIINEAAEEGRHPQSNAFLNEWEMRVHEIIDRYQPDLLYFDNGINYRSLDPWKLRIARYYYNSAWQWQKEVSIQSKSQAYLAGTIMDFERESRAPRQPYDRYWQVDDPIGNKFGYIEGLKLQSAEGIIRNLIDNVACGGNLCLNISPRSDGTIPEDQQQILLTIGRWLKQYGEAIYGTQPYTVFGEGRNIRYTYKPSATPKKGDVVYILIKQWDGKPFTCKAIPADMVKRISSLSDNKSVAYQPSNEGILVKAENKTTAVGSVAFRVEMK